MTSIARLFGFARPVSEEGSPDQACIEQHRALARARARALVQSIAEKQPEGRRR